MDFRLINQLAAKHPKPDHTFTYGTAGFRLKADLLDSVMFRVGLLAVLRSKSHSGKAIGVMVTASHNPEQDNGVKLVEPLGEMLKETWESYAIQLANASIDDLVSEIEKIIKKENINLAADSLVVVGRDTRPSGEALVSSLKDGVNALKSKISDFGLMTTPQLHYVTRCLNTLHDPRPYGEPTNNGYYKKMADAFKRLVKDKPKQSPLIVDCANGIGAVALKELAGVIGSEHLEVKITRDDIVSKGKLNHQCGADYVKLYQRAPEGSSLEPGQRACSLDGDADRIVFYYANDQSVFKLLDGDKIATLAAGYIMKLIKISGVILKDQTPLKVGLVQTAYANGSSTRYAQDIMQVPVVFTPTGVKHLHHEAEHFDVGVYFEANVLFSNGATEAFRSHKPETPQQQDALQNLQDLSDLINQSVGDALSDMLMVEAILVSLGQSFAEWDNAYTDLPSRQEKVKVKNRALFVPINADTELKEPAGIQEKINSLVAKYENGRCFVRPSGTEDIVRVYAEAKSREATDELAFKVCGLVFDEYGGVGDRPACYL